MDINAFKAELKALLEESMSLAQKEKEIDNAIEEACAEARYPRNATSCVNDMVFEAMREKVKAGVKQLTAKYLFDSPRRPVHELIANYPGVDNYEIGSIEYYKKLVREVPGVGHDVYVCEHAGLVRINIVDNEDKPASNKLVMEVCEHVKKHAPVGTVVTIGTCE